MPATLHGFSQQIRQNKAVIYKSVALIALIIATGLLVTNALFFDTQRGNEASFQAGTLDLTVSAQGVGVDYLDISNVGADGVVEQQKLWTVRNVGSLDGQLLFSLEDLQNFENECSEPEREVDSSCEGEETGSLGELGQALVASVTLIDSEGERVVASTTLATDQMDTFARQWQENLGEYVLPAGEAVQVLFKWEVGPGSYDNRIQSDDLGFTIVFDLKQLGLE